MQTSTIDLKKATERELRDYIVPWPETLSELTDIIEALREREHEYGTCVYAMSIAATATFYYIAKNLGVTGFQASCADLDILRRTRHYKHGFQVIDYTDLLYPQYEDQLTITSDKLMSDPSIRFKIVAEAKKLLEERSDIASTSVVNHWKYLVSHYDVEGGS